MNEKQARLEKLASVEEANTIEGEKAESMANLEHPLERARAGYKAMIASIGADSNE